MQRGTLVRLAVAVGSVVLLILISSPGHANANTTFNSPIEPPGLPSVFYGVVQAGHGFTPTVGMPVQAMVNGVSCGNANAVTKEFDRNVVYVIKVGGGGNCGMMGFSVIMSVNGRIMLPVGSWSSDLVQELNLHPGPQIYLPLILR